MRRRGIRVDVVVDVRAAVGVHGERLDTPVRTFRIAFPRN